MVKVFIFLSVTLEALHSRVSSYYGPNPYPDDDDDDIDHDDDDDDGDGDDDDDDDDQDDDDESKANTICHVTNHTMQPVYRVWITNKNELK